MEELRRRLRDVVEERYGGSARAASLAAGLNEGMIWSLLDNPRKRPTLDTLARLAETFDWPLLDVIRWALGYDPRIDREGQDSYMVMAREMTRLGIGEPDRAIVLSLLRRLSERPIGE